MTAVFGREHADHSDSDDRKATCFESLQGTNCVMSFILPQSPEVCVGIASILQMREVRLGREGHLLRAASWCGAGMVL